MKPITTKLEDLKYETLRAQVECEKMSNVQTSETLKDIVKLFEHALQSRTSKAFSKHA